MTTQYTPTLKLALPVTGELSGTWGDVVNDNITSMIEQAIAGLSTINTWTANVHTLTTANGTTSESRCAMLVAATGGGAPTAAGEIICPAAAKLYVLQNNTAFAITLKTSAGTGVAVAASNTAFLFCDGTNVNACVTTIVDGNVTGNLTVGGNATINGNTTLGNATSDTVTATARFNTDLLPSTDNARDLGSSANSWKDLYIDGTAYLALVDINGGTIDGVSIGSTTAATVINVDNLRLDGNTLSSTDSNGNIVIAPNGTGDVQLDADTVRIGDAAAAVTLTSNGAGALTVTTGGAADITISTNSGTTSGTITIANGANGNITLTPDGTGDVILSADRTQFGDSNTDTTLTTNGTGNLNLSTNNGTNSGTIQIAQGVNGNITLTPHGTGLVSIPSVNISGGTANGVTYLDASKVLTSGSALTFDGTYFTVGASSTTGDYKAFIQKAGGELLGLNASSGTLARIAFGNATATFGSTQIIANAADLAFITSSAEKLRLTATSLYTASDVNVGIGTPTPGEKLTVLGGGATSSTVNFTGGAIGNDNATIASDYNLNFQVDANNNIGSRSYNWRVGGQGYSDGTFLMSLNSAGNLGLGVTPSAWTDYKVMQFGGGAIASYTGNAFFESMQNTFWDGAYKYVNNGFASKYEQTGGKHAWYKAPSGTAGNAITFTQAMTLSASAELNIDSGTGGGRLTFQPGATQNQILSTTTGFGAYNILRYIASQHQWLDAASTQAMTLDASGRLGIGPTNPAYTLDVTGSASTARLGKLTITNDAPFVTGANIDAGANSFGLGTSGAASVLFFANNTERARIGSDGTFRVKGAGTAGSTDAFQVAGTAPASAASITSDGNLLVGATSAYVSTFSGITAEGKTSGVGNNLALGLYKAGTPQILDGDVLGNIYFYGADNDVTPGNNNIGARIASIATSNWTTDGTTSNAALAFYTHGTTSGAPEERARITSGGDLLVGTTSASASSVDNGTVLTSTGGYIISRRTSGAAQTHVAFINGGSTVGDISSSTTNTTYNTSSDYRLKNITGPITTSGAYIDSLNPVEGTWKADGSTFVGLIAHEVQEASRTTVATGEKDGEQMQGMDYSNAELIANMLAELKSLRARVAALESSTLQ